jgi:hypothetical protein
MATKPTDFPFPTRGADSVENKNDRHLTDSSTSLDVEGTPLRIDIQGHIVKGGDGSGN